MQRTCHRMSNFICELDWLKKDQKCDSKLDQQIQITKPQKRLRKLALNDIYWLKEPFKCNFYYS